MPMYVEDKSRRKKKSKKIKARDTSGFSGSALFEDQNSIYSTKLSSWGVIFPIICIVAFLVAILLVNSMYHFITLDTFVGGFIYPREKLFALAFIVVVLLLVAFLIIKIFKHRKFELVITKRKVIVKDDFTTSIDLHGIAGVMVNQSFVGNVCGYGDIVISSRSSGVQTLANIPSPNKAKGVIDKIINKNINKKDDDEDEEQRLKKRYNFLLKETSLRKKGKKKSGSRDEDLPRRKKSSDENAKKFRKKKPLKKDRK